MATHSSILAWRIPWTEEPGRLQPMGLQRVKRNRVTITTILKYSFPVGLVFVGEGGGGRLSLARQGTYRHNCHWKFFRGR